jgi:hypothetical protein
VDSYQERAVPFIDFGPQLLAISVKEGKMTDDYFGETSHYNDAGCAHVAEFVFNHLRGNGL